MSGRPGIRTEWFLGLVWRLLPLLLSVRLVSSCIFGLTVKSSDGLQKTETQTNQAGQPNHTDLHQTLKVRRLNPQVNRGAQPKLHQCSPSPCSFHCSQPLPVNYHLHLLVPIQPKERPGRNKQTNRDRHQNLLEFEASMRRDLLYHQFTLYSSGRNRTLRDRSLSISQPPEVKFSPVTQPHPPQD